MTNFVILFSLTEIFSGTFFYLTFVVSVFGFIGLMSKSFNIAAFSAFIAFVTITVESGYGFFENLLIVIMVLLIMLLSFQIYGMTQGGNAESTGA